MIAAALPHIGVLWRPHAVAAFFRTSLEPVWGRPLIIRDALPGVTTPGGLLTLVAVALATFGAIAALRGELLPTGDRVTVPDAGGGDVTAVQVSPSA